MGAFSAETEAFLRQAMERHSAMVYRLAYARTRNAADAQDVYQEAFLRLALCKREFADDEHMKAWLIRTASNVCKNHLKRKWRKRENLDSAENTVGEMMQTNEVLDAVLALPDKYKTVVYLYYYEGYAGKEIAAILKKPASTVRNLLRDARKQLKEKLGEDFCEE